MIKNKPEILALGDFHISKDNILESEKNWDEALKVAVELGIKTIVIGGDWYQSRVSQTLSVLISTKGMMIKARNLGICVIFAEGNHDKVALEADFGYSKVFDSMDNVEVVTYKCIGTESGKFDLHILSYYPETGSAKQKIDSICTDGEAKQILICHQGINGALAHSDATTNKELPTHIFDKFDNTIVFHYHNRCKIKDTDIEYVGSSRQHNFGEDEEKGYTVINSDGSYYFVKNEVNKRYITLDTDYADVNDSLFEEIKELIDDNYKIRVSVICNKKQKNLINKSLFIDAGVSKVKIVESNVDKKDVKKTSAFVRFDRRGIKDAYTTFSEEKSISDELGQKYFDLKEPQHVQT